MSKKDDDFMATMHQRFDAACSADNELRVRAVEDIKFVHIPGEQWDPTVKRKRKNRPCYEFNKIRQAVKQIKNEQRQNRPSIKLRAVDGKTDPVSRDVMQGMIRNIESVSNADRAYDTAFEFAITAGFGVWRITTGYSSDDAFDQDVMIKEVRNPFSVRFDPTARDWDRRDANYAFVDEMISKADFKVRFPGKEESEFQTNGVGEAWDHWNNDDSIRIAEYWYKEPVTKTIFLMSDGSVNEDTPDFREGAIQLAAQGIQIVQQREIKSYKIKQCLVSGSQILEGPYDWAGRFIPIVIVWGDMLSIEGRDYWYGMVRPSRDAQKLYNFNRTTAMERVANTPLAPYKVTPAMIVGFENYWKEANAENFPFLPYNVDPQAPGGQPQRERPPDIPAAQLTLSQQDSDDIKATTGVYDASLGARSNETSGKAINARDRQAETANFDYVDNLSRAIQYTGEILVDLIPKIYDTERMVRILGEDSKETWAIVNANVAQSVKLPDGKTVVIPNLRYGKYDVTVTTGPSFTTQRMEMADAMLQLSNSATPDSMIAKYLAVKSMDIPGAEPYLKAYRKLLVQQGLIEPDPEDGPPQPNPAQEAAQAAQQEAMMAEIENKKLANAKLAADIENQQIDMAKKQQEMQKSAIETPPELNGKELDNVNKQLDALLKEKQLNAPEAARV